MSGSNEFEEELNFICDYYKDLQKDLLSVQLQTLMVDNYEELNGTHVSEISCITIFDFKKYFRITWQSLPSAQKDLLEQVCKIMKLVLVMPATNTSSERSFSTLHKVKSSLQSTGSQLIQAQNILLVRCIK